MSETPQTNPALEQLLGEVSRVIRAGDMPRAFDLARDGLDRGLEHPGLLGLRSLWWEHQGRYEEALIDLDRALELAPNDFASLNARGLVLDKLQRLPEAVTAFEMAITQEPRFAPAYHNLGWAREAVGDQEGARLAYEHALALKPDFVEPLAHLARLAVRRGDSNSARVHGQQALRIDADQATALIALAEAEFMEGAVPDAEGRIRRVLAGDQATPLDRGVALKLLGDVLDAQSRFPEAFAAYEAGNRELKALFAPRFASGRGQTAPEMMTWLAAHMAKIPEQAWRRRATNPDPDGPAVHVFMTGFPRSGSVFLESVLASDPAAAEIRGLDALGEGVRDFMADPQDLDLLARVADADLEPYRRAYWRRVRETGVDPRGKLFVDRLPLNSVRAPLIARLFPDAKMVFCLRDPRDVVLSCFRGRFQMNPTMYEFLSLDGAARTLDLTLRLMLLYREKLPLSIGLVRYEDVVEEPESQLTSLCGFLGVEFSPQMRAFAATESAAADPAERGFYGETIGAWRRYAAELAPVFSVLKTWVNTFGYRAD
jgi:Tfp pilus assembly protein PilF